MALKKLSRVRSDFTKGNDKVKGAGEDAGATKSGKPKRKSRGSWRGVEALEG
jgi:hypothetical protein